MPVELIGDLFAGVREHLADRGPEPERAVTDREHRRGHAATLGRAGQVGPGLGGFAVAVVEGGSTSTIGRRRRAAASASPSRVWAFSRPRSRSSSVWNAARSATGGRAASRIVDTLGSVGWLDMVKSFFEEFVRRGASRVRRGTCARAGQ